MGQLNDIRMLIEKKIESDKLDAAAIRGQIGLKSGTLLGFVNATTPDDAAKIAKLKQAAKEVLNLSV